MGFETERVKGGQDPNGILQEFICSICQGLIALDSVRTACHHLFCRHCLEEWLTKDRGSKIPRTSTNVGLHRQISAHDACPACKTDLVDYGGNYPRSGSACTIYYRGGTFKVTPLFENAILFRMLKKIQVKCPSDEACSWEGCYGDAMAHLTNRNYHPSVLACQLVIPKKHRTPKFIRLSGAAIEIVNGIYKPTDFFDDRQRFDKDTMVDGSQRRISIVWCKHGVGAWYISILDVERPGTNKDYDIFFSEEEKQGRFPPIGGWRLAENGVVPCPIFEFLYDD